MLPTIHYYHYEFSCPATYRHCSNTTCNVFYRLPLESPIVVMGDRSGSMDIAIRTSTIIASILTAITNARLVFFNTQNMEPDRMPSNIEEVLEMALSIEADAATSPAASLYPFYEKKEVVKTFIIVTDEEENEPFEGYK